ncbi:hypothetical protein [Streptomyces vinaceus]|uniref:hypothetical protein n=1 Tax=Streptomyces vinaceus TaxID=1960 RepID=UPI0036BF4411
MEIDGLDFTRKPGVLGARVDTYTPAGGKPEESAPDGRVLITESVQEALVHTVSETAAAPVAVESAGIYADPGYLADKEKRLPLTTKAQAKAAWLQVRESETAREYTSAQLKRINQRVVKTLRGYGVRVSAQEGWLIDPIGAVSEEVAECLGFSDDPGHGGSMSISLTNGPTTVTVSSWCVDPHDLDAVGRAAMAGACQAIATIDPDLDADIDVSGASAEDTDGDMGGEAATESALESSAPETPAADTTTLEEETAMAESTTPAAEAATAPATGGVTLTDEQFKALLAAVAPQPVAVESAPAEPVAEAAPAEPAPAVTESDDDRIARLVAEGIAKALPQAVQEHVEATGGPARKGFVAPVTESATAGSGSSLPEGWPQKPLHQYTDDEWRQTAGNTIVGAILGNRQPPQG